MSAADAVIIFFAPGSGQTYISLFEKTVLWNK